MGEYYNMYPWPQMMPGMVAGVVVCRGGRGAGVPGMQLMSGCMSGMQVMLGWQPGMQPGLLGMPGGDNVYHPSLDFLSASSHTSTPAETQYTGDETFSLEELGIDLEDSPIHTGE